MAMRYVRTATGRTAVMAVAVAVTVMTPAFAADLPRFGLPIDCTPGLDCFVQKYVDVDPTDGFKDYACGSLSSDGHKGTDFRVRPGQTAGVLAAADGTVKAVRDGMRDNVFSEPIDVPSTQACGNAVLIDHGDGVESIVCHMTPGSLQVTVGDVVNAGDVLGRVGASGFADFLHVHFQIMADGDVLDPFTGLAMSAARCSDAGTPLWSDEASRALAQNPRTAILSVGFSDGPVTIEAIQDGLLPTTISGDAGALVAYGFVFGAQSGDTHQITLKGPGIDVENTTGQERNQAQSMRFAGRRLPNGLQPGQYTMRYAIVRNGEVLDEQIASFAVE